MARAPSRRAPTPAPAAAADGLPAPGTWWGLRSQTGRTMSCTSCDAVLDRLAKGLEAMRRPDLHVGAVTITPEPARARELAEFYHRLLGWPIVDIGPKGGWAQLRPPDGEIGPTINIEEDRSHARPVWPSRAGEQTATMHLDIGVDELDAAVAWALEAGATEAEHQPQLHVRVMLDPHGHPFCLCRGTRRDGAEHDGNGGPS